MAKLKCCGCKERFDKESMISLPAGNFHSYDCATIYARNKADKARNARINIEKRKDAQEHRKAKESLKTKRDYLKDAQVAVNAYIRIRDDRKPCISCGSTNKQANMVDAGHYRSVGSAPHIRFYTLNIHGQCVRCNRDLSGNSVEMRKGIIDRYGVEMVEHIESLYFDNKPSIDYLKRLIKIMRNKKKLYERLFR